MTAPSDLVIHHRSEGACVASLGGFVLVRTFGNVSPESIHATLKAHHAALLARPDGVASINVIERATEFPSEPARSASIEVASKTNERVLAVATVILGDGFWASALRGALTTIQVMGGGRQPKRVFGKESEAIEWTVLELREPPQRYRIPLLQGLSAMASDAV